MASAISTPRKSGTAAAIGEGGGLCFRICLSFLPEMIHRSLGRDDIQIDFILEAGHRNAGDAQRVFNQVKGGNIQEISPLIKSFSFGDEKRFPGLQAADS
jgi:hypothetical protein